MKADKSGAVIGAPLVVGRGLKVLEEERLQLVAAGEVGCNDGEETPAFLAGVQDRRLVVGCLLHHLAEHLVLDVVKLVAEAEDSEGTVHAPLLCIHT